MEVLPKLLAAATLLPLVSFFVILLAGNKLKSYAATVATFAIGGAAVLSFVGMFGFWLSPNDVNWKELERVNAASHQEHEKHAGPGKEVSGHEHDG
ncbi:MAG: hypothetical protein GY888_12575, partial [Planctomycetaceae bacterium]|nr:hypothetical protein [Planctomycetaceae bacterium]